MKLVHTLLLTFLLTSTTFANIIRSFAPPSRTEKNYIRGKRRLAAKPRKLNMLATIGGAAVGGLAANYFLGPGHNQKRRVQRIMQDVLREKQQFVFTVTRRGAIINMIENMIVRCEEKLGELSSQSVARVYSLNALIESANLKQIKAIKKYTAAVQEHLEDYDYSYEEDEKKNK